ncbi:RagB/SusD family nutrient uptake outer membrane protein [Chitinophaga caeni]|uniref:RagB/SusD family nutrient uptake outer membrane protein n=1 Tax=Chitinophaga caeni TaxID=2029983 RepID=A0A291R1F8_9BACT|nr:RagB/SusD family nutrient uptake outer membrane protein [Chitinophaga caeni]ATL49971.1 RagB/SusD family nutrient uptake outer membrane protein [Chitinophaga caeni]
MISNKLLSKGKYLSLFFFALVMLSCSKDYLTTNPTDQVATEDAFSTTDNAWAAVNGIHRYLYSQFYSNQDQGGQSANMIYMNVMGRDLVMTAAGNGWFNNEYKWISHRISTSRVPFFNYAFYYTIIGNANMILANVDGATGPEEDKMAIKGEAYAYRAWAYYQMVQLFGERYVKGGDNSSLAVPLKLMPNEPITPRNTVEEVYTQINADLDQAKAMLQNYNRANISHLDLNVAEGLKARVALTQQRWDSAAYYAARARDGFTLMSDADYMSGFNDYSNDEWIWGVHQQSDQTTYYYSFFAYMSCNFGSSNIRGNPKAIFSPLYAKITDTDVRKQLWDSTGKNTDFPIPNSGKRYPYMSRKFRVADGGSSIGDLVLMRASEMILIEAEANARDGKTAEAAQALYTLAHQRDPNYVMSTNTGAALIDEILTQRRIELWGEGFDFYDLKRMNIALDRRGGNHNSSLAGDVLYVEPTDKRWQFVIPQDEINNTNGIVVQNPL